MAGKRGRGRGRGRGKKADPAVEAPVEETPVEETPVEETPVDETKQEIPETEQTEDENMETTEAQPEEKSEMDTSEVKNEADTNEETSAPDAQENTEETPQITPEADKHIDNPWRGGDKNSTSLFLQVRGFPYETSIEEMTKYFELADGEYKGCEIAVGIRGKPCGEFFFECENEEIALKVLMKHKEIYVDTGRYVDVFRCSEEYYNRRLSINLHFSEKFDGTIKFKFIPFNSSPEGVVKSILEGINYLEDTLTCPTSASGKTTGIAFVQFANFSEARKALEKSGQMEGVKIVESCNNELRSALLGQAKLTYMKKWADASVGGGTYFNKNKRESQPSESQTSEPTEPKKPKTEVTPASFIADIKSNAPNNIKKEEEAPVAVTPPKPKPVNNSPYPHIITLSNVAAGTKATEIQKFFKPHRAIAVNIRAGGMVDVAFKTHDTAEKAMEKQGSNLKDFVPDFELNSVA